MHPQSAAWVFLSLLAFAACREQNECAEPVSMLQQHEIGSGKAAMARRHLASRHTVPPPEGLYCCDSTVGDSSPVLLACDADPSDYITAVPFAVLGEAPSPGEQLYHCGVDEFPGACSTGIEESELLKACVGKQTCAVNTSHFASPCPDASHLQFRVRWTCHCNEQTCTREPAALPPLPLRAEGNILVDATGSRFRVNGVNWAGAHITNAPGGLDRTPLSILASRIRALGFNVVRLTWSVESVLQNPVVDSRVVAANPQLVGLRALEVLDAVVTALAHEGVLIWLDNHMLDTDWCCDRSDCNGFWFNARFSEDDWVRAWSRLAKRYSKVEAFVGVGLKNEPRSTCGGRSWGGEGGLCNATCLDPAVGPMGCVEMQWSGGPEKYQWRRAATRAGLAVLEAKSSLLVSVSGLEYSTQLQQFAREPVQLPRENVVYEAHDYSWSTYSRSAGKRLANGIPGHTDPLSENDAKHRCDELGHNCSGVTCVGTNLNCTVRKTIVMTDGPANEFTFLKELDGQDLYPRYAGKLTEFWGFLLRDRVAPVFLSEIGFSQTFQGSAEEDYVARLSSYILDGGPLAKEGGLDWAVWQLGGVQVGGTGRTAGATESFGVLGRCWTGPASAEHYGALRRLMAR